MLNNVFTYRDQRLSGWRFLTGLLRFQLICAIGAIANVGLAIFIYGSTHIWWLLVSPAWLLGRSGITPSHPPLCGVLLSARG